MTPEDWRTYVEEHREELNEQFEWVGKMLREGNTEALVTYIMEGMPTCPNW